MTYSRTFRRRLYSAVVVLTAAAVGSAWVLLAPIVDVVR